MKSSVENPDVGERRVAFELREVNHALYNRNEHDSKMTSPTPMGNVGGNALCGPFQLLGEIPIFISW